MFKWGAQYKVKDGHLTSFWHDPWLGDAPLRLQYPRLFNFCDNKQSTVRDCYDGDDWNLSFNRSLDEGDVEAWEELMANLDQEHPTDGAADMVSWGLEKSGMFTTKSLYRAMTHGGIISKVNQNIWKCNIPTKIKIFLWQMYHGKLPAADVLSKKGWKGNRRCSICGRVETISHIFFACPMGTFIWGCIRDICGWEGFPTSTWDFFDNWLPNKPRIKDLGLSVFAGLLWAIWRTRNKIAIEKKFPKSPTETLLYGSSFLQKWEVLQKGEEKNMMKQARAQLLAWSRSFTPTNAQTTDVFEL